MAELKAVAMPNNFRLRSRERLTTGHLREWADELLRCHNLNA